MKLLYIYFFLVVSLISNSQTFDLDLLNKLYPDQPILYTSKEEKAEITNEKGELKIVKHVKEQFLILNDKGKGFDARSIYTNSFIEIKNIKAVNYARVGNRLNKILVTDIKVKDSNSDGNFYDDLKKITITYPVSTPGSLIDLEYDEVYKEPRFFGSVYLSESYPVLNMKFSVKSAPDVVLNIKGFNTDSLNIKTKVKNNKSCNYQEWEVDSISALKFEDNGPVFKKIASYYMFSVKEFQGKNGQTPLVGSVDNLYKWFLHLVKNLNKHPSEHIQLLTDSLTKDCKTDIEKVKKIYYWVQDKISYVAYEDGLGGYIPREADAICKRRFGDCKDMASILTAMGKAANVPIYLTWIGTRDIPYQFTEMPVPMAANHMIATYLTKDTCLFLDATGKFQDLGTHTAFIQGKEAIINLSDSQYVIKKVPVLPSNINHLRDSLCLKIKGNELYGKGYLKGNGYYKVRLQNRLDGKSYEEQKSFIAAFCEKGNNKFKLDTFIVLSNKRDEPVELYYEFKIPNYVTDLKSEVIANVNFDRNFMDEYSTKNRYHDFVFNCTFKKEVIVNVDLEKNQKVKYIPGNISFNKNNFNYLANYKTINNGVYYINKIDVNQSNILKKDFPVWSDFVNEINKNNNKAIVLEKL